MAIPGAAAAIRKPWRKEACELLARGAPVAAAAVLGPAVRARPDDAELQALLALALLGLRRSAEALGAAERAAALRPGAEWAHRLRALALGRLGRSGAAVEAASEAVRIAPSEAAAHRALGAALLGVGRAGEAVEALHRAAVLAPRDPEARRMLGDAVLLRDPEVAERHYLASLENAPAHAPTLARLGLALERQRRFPEAERWYDEAERIDPRVRTPRRRRAELVLRIQLGLGIFVALLAAGAVPAAARRLGLAGPWLAWAVWGPTVALPLAALLWSAVKLWRTPGEEAAPDPQVLSILRAFEPEGGATAGRR